MASKRRLVLMAVIVAVAAVAVSIRRAVRDPKPTPTSAYVQIPSAHLAPAQVQRPASREPAPAADVTHPLQASTEIEQRVFRFETAFLARLSRLSPEAALAELDRVLARPAGAPADRLTDERLERVLAAAYLAWCVSRRPSLLEAARGVARSRAEAEADPMVRQQLVWILAGTKLGPVSVEVEDRDGNARTIEAFSPRDDSGAAWARALLDVAKPFDASLLRWLAERAENPKEKAGAAAFHALLAGGGDDARRTALELFARHPWLRPSAVPALAKNAPVDVLGAFVAVLPATKDSLSVRAMCRALETSAVVPARSGAALLDTYQAQGVEPTGEGPRTRAVVAHAAARILAVDGDADARECVRRALGDPAPEVSLETVEAALDLNKEVFVAPIRAAWRETSDPFRKAALAYGLRGLDPAFQEPNPFWEQRLLKGELKMATSEADRQRILERLKRVQAEIPAKGP